MYESFSGAALRTARLLKGFSLEEVATHVGKTRQYISKLETGGGAPANELAIGLASVLGVAPIFFEAGRSPTPIAEEQVHFRRLATTKVSVKQIALAKASLMQGVVELLERHLQLPQVRIPQLDDLKSAAEIERAAETCRHDWGIGLGPISDVTRLAENVGAVVTTFSGISKEVDALSFVGARPIIVRNDAKESACRQRFDIAHELGHCVMHSGRVTGDRVSEGEANRFAGALLVPRSMMLKFFPRARGSFLDWKGISEFKLIWKVSKAALLYRARQLELIPDDLYRRGAIALRRGEAVREKEDDLIPMERPALLQRSISLLREQLGITLPVLASQLGVSAPLLEELLNEGGVPCNPGSLPRGQNVISLSKRT